MFSDKTKKILSYILTAIAALSIVLMQAQQAVAGLGSLPLPPKWGATLGIVAAFLANANHVVQAGREFIAKFTGLLGAKPPGDDASKG